MDLNLHIIRDELPDIPFCGVIHTKPWEFPLAYAMLCEDGAILEDPAALYICDPFHLPCRLRDDGRFFILCAGTPDEKWLNGACSLLYTEAALTPARLLNLVVRIFRKYQLWEQSMEQALLTRQPVRTFGMLTMPFLNNPIFLQGSRFQCLFQIIPGLPDEKLLTPLQKRYLELYTIADNDFIPSDDINEYLAKKGYQYIAYEREPVCEAFNNGLDIRGIYLNLFSEDTHIGLLCVDDVFRPFQDKDYAVISILGRFLKGYLEETEIYSISRARDFDQMLRQLLNRRDVPCAHVEKLLSLFDWRLNDAYFCVALKPMVDSGREDTLSSTALRVDSHFTDEIYIIHEQSILLVFNMSRLKQTQRELFSASLPLLRDHMLLGGCSAEFYDFREFPDYYAQALDALKTGQQLSPSFWYFFYDDYTMPCLLKNCRDKRPVSLLIPGYLKRLLAYDARKNSSYIELLNIYLSHDRNITDTAAHADVHRTTVLYRLKRIQEITGIDLDDYQTRLTLMLSLEILKRQS